MIPGAICVAAILLLIAAYILFSNYRQRRLGGLPVGELVSDDNLAEVCPVLVSHRYGLKGKPDALVRVPSGGLVPVERKKARGPVRPYDGDLIQAIVYCILVEEQYGVTPPFMRIQYADRLFDEPYTPDRKEWALRTAQRLRESRGRIDCQRSHRVPAKCRNCSQRPNCDQALR